jgi:hypothetical protein
MKHMWKYIDVYIYVYKYIFITHFSMICMYINDKKFTIPIGIDKNPGFKKSIRNASMVKLPPKSQYEEIQGPSSYMDVSRQQNTKIKYGL